jgi:hypothetical protein
MWTPVRSPSSVRAPSGDGIAAMFTAGGTDVRVLDLSAEQRAAARWKEARSDAPRCGAVEAAADLPGRSSTKPEPGASARTSTPLPAPSPEPINRSRPPNIFFPVLQHAPRCVAQQPKRIEGTKNTGLTGPAATGMTYQLTGIAGLVPAAVRCGW